MPNLLRGKKIEVLQTVANNCRCSMQASLVLFIESNNFTRTYELDI